MSRPAGDALPRILDANANRAREALRVLEDAARFALDDAALCSQWKDVRHGLQGALAGLPPGWLEAHRAVEHDVGRAVEGAHEFARASHRSVVQAAGKRLGEALRSVEECLKVVDPAAARTVEALRYQAYAAEAALVLRMGSPARAQWRVCVLLTQELCAQPWERVVRAAVAGGADCIQVREKSMSTAALCQHVRAVMRVAEEAGSAGAGAGGAGAGAGGAGAGAGGAGGAGGANANAGAGGAAARPAIIVNDRVDVALACGADGVHVGQDDLAVQDVRRICGTQLLVGASTHSPEEAAAAVEAGADYLGVGAMFSSTTKPAVAATGLAYLQHVLRAHPGVAHLAIGGIHPQNAAQLAAVGARGVAVSSCVCAADDPAAVVRALRQCMECGAAAAAQ